MAAAANPSASYSVDGNVITFTVIAEPGFFYAAEYSDDLINWLPIGGRLLATGEMVEFPVSINQSHRFYRFSRTP